MYFSTRADIRERDGTREVKVQESKVTRIRLHLKNELIEAVTLNLTFAKHYMCTSGYNIL